MEFDHCTVVLAAVHEGEIAVGQEQGHRHQQDMATDEQVCEVLEALTGEVP